jgi:hypothetical protein
MAFTKKNNTPRFVVTGSPRAMKIQAQFWNFKYEDDIKLKITMIQHIKYIQLNQHETSLT